MRLLRRTLTFLNILLMLSTAVLASSGAQGTIYGKVQDAQGTGVADGTVEVVHEGMGTVAAAGTGSDGSFSAVVGAEGGTPYFAMGTGIGLREGLSWQPRGGGIYFGVNPTADITIRAERAFGNVRGTVQDAVTGRPIAWARVDLHRLSGGSLYGVGLQGSVRTDPNGRYLFAEVPDEGGQGYQMQVLAEGYDAVDMFTGVGLDPKIQLRPAYTPVVGTVLDKATGLPLLGAKVDLYRVGLGLEESTTTYATGAFVLNPRSGSDYVLWVSNPKYRPLEVRFTADPAKPPQLVDSKALRLVPELARVSGTVTEAGSGDPVVSTVVELMAADTGRLGATISDVNGHFALDGIWADLSSDYWIEVSPTTSQWGYARSKRFALPGGADKTVDVTAPRAATLRGEAGVIAGKIYDARGGTLSGVSLSLRRVGTNEVVTGTSGTGGAYRFEDLPASQWSGMDASLPSNGYLLTIDDSRYHTSRLAGASSDTITPLTVRPGAATPANLWTRPATITLRGKVTDEAGAPVSSARVSLDSSGFPTPSDGTHSSGEYVVTGIPTLRGSIYVPVASRDGFLASAGSLFAATDKDVTANLVIRRSTGTLVGNVKDTNNAAVTGAEIRVDLAGTTQSWQTRTGNDGTYRIEGLPVGTGPNLIVRGFKDGYYGMSMRQVNVDMVIAVSLRPGETATRDLRATSANGIVRGRVFTDAPRKPAMGATVYLRMEGYGYILSTSTDADGNFSFTNLPMKYRYGVRAVQQGYIPGDIQVINSSSAGAASLYPNEPLRIRDIKLIPVTSYDQPQFLPGAPSLRSGPQHPPAYAGIFTSAPGASRVGTPAVLQLRAGMNYAMVNARAAALQVAPMIVSGRTLVPLRFVGEALGATVDYEATDRKVTYNLGERTVVLWIDQTRALVGSEENTLDVAPTIVDGRTLVPLRFVGSALGAQVDYDSNTGAIWLMYNP